MGCTVKDSKKAPLCKGGWIFAKQKDWGIVKSRQLTIPPSKIKDFCHLPLHKGGFLVLSYAVTSRENVRHIFRTLGVPKTLKLSHD